MVKSFQIGGFSFQIISREKITIPENFLKFQISNREIPSFTYQMFLSPAVFMQDEEVLTVRDDLIVYKTKIGEGRLLRFKGQKAYANYRETDAHAAEIIVENEAIEDPVDTLFYIVICFRTENDRSWSFDPPLCLHRVSGKRHSLLCSIRSRKIYAGGIMGEIQGQ